MECITVVFSPLNVQRFHVQAATLNSLKWHTAQDDGHRQQFIAAQVLHVTIVNEKHLHFVRIHDDIDNFTAIPPATLHVSQMTSFVDDTKKCF